VEWITDGASFGFGCRGVAVALMYAQSPMIATGISPIPTTISASQVSVRFLDMLSGSSFEPPESSAFGEHRVRCR